MEMEEVNIGDGRDKSLVMEGINIGGVNCGGVNYGMA